MNSLLLKRLGFAVLVIVIILVGVVTINNYLNNNINSTAPNLLFGTIKLKNVTGFEYLSSDKDFRFTKKDDKWYINNLPSSSRIVEITISKILNIELGDLISEDVNSYSIYQVNDDKSKIIINSSDGNTIAYVGKATFEGGSFVRQSESTKTYSTTENINSIMDNDITFFKDKTITAIDPSTITSFFINDNQYQKIADQWIKNGKIITTQSVSTLLADISNVEGIGFADVTDVDSIKSQPSELIIKIMTNNNEYSFSYIKYKENTYIKSDSSEYLLTMDTIPQQIQQIDLDL